MCVYRVTVKTTQKLIFPRTKFVETIYNILEAFVFCLEYS